MAPGISKRKCLQVIISIIILQIIIVAVVLYQENTELKDDELSLHNEVKTRSPNKNIIRNTEGQFKVLPDEIHLKKLKMASLWSTNTTKVHTLAEIQMSPEDLLDTMATKYHWKWMRSRVINHWPDWMNAADQLLANHNMQNRTKLEILVSPGLLTQTNFAQMESIKHGGPLGELVQWADLIAALSLLGHNVTLQHNIKITAAMLSYIAQNTQPDGCFTNGPDLIFTDYFGLYAMSDIAIRAFRNKFRVLDIYGTEAPWNNPKMAEQNGYDVHDAFDLHLQQFFTLYPTTPDNSFLGFVVRPVKLNADVEKRNIAVVYGKEANHIVHSAPMLRALSVSFELHSTTTRAAFLPHFIINHGVLSSSDYTSILQSAKVMIGVGHPVEGPGALEAIAKGLIFLNPSIPNHQNPLEHKPTSRKMSSQVPYAEKYIGPPNVITLDTYDLNKVIEAIPQLNKTVEPVLPFEFTMEGYLERLNYYLKYQGFCKPTQDQQLQKSLIFKQSKVGQDCIETCSSQGLVCDRSLFSLINGQTFYESDVPACKHFSANDSSTTYPALDVSSGTCYLQQNPKLFSCAGFLRFYERFCPCRKYRRHQIALCETCR